jgi:AcrR family transcriptional regulator
VKVESAPRPDQVSRGLPADVRSRHRRGRPRQPATRDAIVRATIELLTEVGFDGATTNAIVARSGCSKATIYRRWASRDALIMDALRTVFRGQPEDIQAVVAVEPEIGLVHAAARRGAKAFGSRLFREVFPTVARELLAGGAMGQQFLTDVFQPIRTGAKSRLEQVVARGEIGEDIDADLLFDLIYGALLYRVLMGEPVDDNVADSIADLVVIGTAPGHQGPDA